MIDGRTAFSSAALVAAALFAGEARADARWDTCAAFGQVRSLNSDVAVTVTFRNMTAGYRSVMWIGFDGVPKPYANLDPGQEFAVATFLTHPWMFTDGPGNCIEMFMPHQGVPVFNITAPDRPGAGD